MIKKILIGLLVTLGLGFVLLYATGHGYIVTSLQRTYLVGNVTANINDHTEFATRTIKTGQREPLPAHPDYNKRSLTPAFLAELERFNSAAFLVVKDGQVLYERYFNGYDARSKTNSFSMAKTVTTLLLGIAIAEGHVDGLDQPVTDFLPEFKSDVFGRTATIGQLSAMDSGYKWDEHYYSPFSPTVELLYGHDIRGFLLAGEFIAEPGSVHYYSSASTELMGIFLERALQKAGAADNLSNYLSEKIWQPLQMNDDALWHLDDNGMELVFCCINTNARNFAKLGLLMMNNGRWNEQQVVPANFIEQMIQPGLEQYYGLSTWLGMHKSPAHFWFSGHLGQHIVSVPEHNLVIVRLGERSNPDKNHIDDTVPEYVDQALHLIR